MLIERVVLNGGGWGRYMFRLSRLHCYLYFCKISENSQKKTKILKKEYTKPCKQTVQLTKKNNKCENKRSLKQLLKSVH